MKHYSSEGAYRRSTAYIKMHHIKTNHPKAVAINGKIHKIRTNDTPHVIVLVVIMVIAAVAIWFVIPSASANVSQVPNTVPSGQTLTDYVNQGLSSNNPTAVIGDALTQSYADVGTGGLSVTVAPATPMDNTAIPPHPTTLHLTNQGNLAL